MNSDSKKLHNLSVGFMILAFALIIADLIIKFLITGKFESGETISLADGLITIGRIENLRLAHGFNGVLSLFVLITVVFQVFFVMLFIRIQIREIDRYFKYSSTLIVFGWIGNYLDRLLFAKGNGGYVHLDYFNLALTGNSVINLSSLIILIGWILFIVVAVINFNEFKGLFRKESSLSSGD